MRSQQGNNLVNYLQRAYLEMNNWDFTKAMVEYENDCQAEQELKKLEYK